MFMNPTMYYHNVLMEIFTDALIKDNNSKYKGMTKLQLIEDILNQYVDFRIDENDVIYEVINNIETEVFQNNKKNDEAIYCIKILLKEYNIKEDILE